MTTARISAANMAAKLGRAKQACAEYKALLAGSDLSYAQRQMVNAKTVEQLVESDVLVQ